MMGDFLIVFLGLTVEFCFEIHDRKYFYLLKLTGHRRFCPEKQSSPHFSRDSGFTAGAQTSLQDLSSAEIWEKRPTERQYSLRSVSASVIQHLVSVLTT
ncbi:RNA binding protein fox-1 [Sarotherodon galilaeus]